MATENDHAYVVSYTKEQLQAAPASSIDELTQAGGMEMCQQVHDYDEAPRCWEP